MCVVIGVGSVNFSKCIPKGPSTLASASLVIYKPLSNAVTPTGFV